MLNFFNDGVFPKAPSILSFEEWICYIPEDDGEPTLIEAELLSVREELGRRICGYCGIDLGSFFRLGCCDRVNCQIVGQLLVLICLFRVPSLPPKGRAVCTVFEVVVKSDAIVGEDLGVGIAYSFQCVEKELGWYFSRLVVYRGILDITGSGVR